MIPRSRSASTRYWLWPVIVKRARSAPGGGWQLLLPDAPESVVKTIRLRRHKDLILDDGRLEARAENRYRDRDGNRKANVWVRFVPTGTVSDQDTPRLEGHTP